ncbi:Rieske (2Fe-2S) protein [Streptomyces sp.]|uniref:Rieske (2Fe-2S) protein n=1 Tax=Streptomyces sp. TaxID=1931 RepID=UPI002810F221|nr:Rieske (2Fe-2S) protein [Streptomyces sp.]
MSAVARRTVVSAAGGAGLAAALAACGGGTGERREPDGKTDGGGEGAVLATTGEVPVGGGKVVAGHGVVITQPKPGEFKAFSSTCPHAGCTVGRVEAGAIVCPCHQSRFDLSDGSVTSGPAKEPLPPMPIQVLGEEISFG